MAPSDGEMSPGELGRTLRRIEAAFATFVLQAVHDAEMKAMREDIADLQDTRKTYGRMLAGAILAALVPSLILLLKIKAPS